MFEERLLCDIFSFWHNSFTTRKEIETVRLGSELIIYHQVIILAISVILDT